MYLLIFQLQGIFPNYGVVKLLLDCNAEVNAKNESKSTPLHIASNPYNYVGDVCIFKFCFNFRSPFNTSVI